MLPFYLIAVFILVEILSFVTEVGVDAEYRYSFGLTAAASPVAVVVAALLALGGAKGRGSVIKESNEPMVNRKSDASGASSKSSGSSKSSAGSEASSDESADESSEKNQNEEKSREEEEGAEPEDKSVDSDDEEGSD